MEEEDKHEQVLLEHTQQNVFMHFLPVIIVMATFCAVGMVGNILAIVFYATQPKPSSTISLIVFLAIVDTIVCLMIIPNILEMVYNVTHTSEIPCKLTHVVGLWTIACSCLILWVIAIDRYRKICKPFARQMTLRSSRYIVAGIVVFGFALSLRNFVNFDTVEVSISDKTSNKSIFGHYCTTRDEQRFRLSVSIFNVIDFGIIIMVWVTLLLTYSKAIVALVKLRWKRVDTHGKKQQPNKDKEQTAKDAKGKPSCIGSQKVLNIPLTSTDVNFSEISVSARSWEGNTENSWEPEEKLTAFPFNERKLSSSKKEKYSVSKTNKESSTNIRTGQPLRRRKKPRGKFTAIKSKTERNLTTMMFAVSLTFIACFIPYFTVRIIMRTVLSTGEEYELDVGIQVALRLPYLNSVFNPLIYCIFNSQFRTYIADLILRR